MVYAIMTALLLGSAPPSEAMKVSATIDADALEVGKEYALVLRASFAPGLSESGAGVPMPLVQIQVPSSVRLVGKELTTHKELSKNGFLHAPFERVMRGHEDRIKFTVMSAPKQGEEFALNVMAYVSDEGSGDAWFVRRRLSVPLAPQAESREVSADESTWGVGETLNIGDTASDFSLPQADGKTVNLKDFRGKYVIVTMYRAHW